jgi:hypothetical protein
MYSLKEKMNQENFELENPILINGYKLEQTSFACPEQYDVFDKDDNYVGYLRLRHGKFRADYPCCGGETVYESSTKGDGIFNPEERMTELTRAVEALNKKINENL